MIYYDIHTHKAPDISDDIAVVNSVVKEEMPSNKAEYRSYGIHPWYIEDIGKQMDLLQSLVVLPETVAVGEAGLDKLAEAGMPLQEKIFKEQAILAGELQKPLIIHCVKAWAELLAIKKDLSPQIPWIIHGFRSNKELAQQLLSHGFFLSFGENFNVEALKTAWPDSFFVETDESSAGIQNIYRLVASSLNIPIDVIASQLAENIKVRLGLFK